MDFLVNERKFIHDVKNPLSIAYGQCRLLIRSLEGSNAGDTAALKERAEKILAALDRMNQMLDAHRASLFAEDGAPKA